MPSNPDPAFVVKNVRTLSVIGGVYDLIAIEVYETHRELLMGAGFGSYNDIVSDLRRTYSGIPYEGPVAERPGAGADPGSQ